MNFWNGSFAPLRKHRDYLHASFLEHELANGGYYTIDDVFYCDTDPITERLLQPNGLYYLVNLRLHREVESSEVDISYKYLIPAESDNSSPDRNRVEETIQEYNARPVEGGRDFNDYIVELDEDDDRRERLDELRDNIVPRVYR